MNDFDFLVIGGGIAGASVAAHLAENASVAILEMEERAGYHTTGRSAAAYEPNYGASAMATLAKVSGAFFKNPPPGFSDAPIFTKRGSVVIESIGQGEAAKLYLTTTNNIREISIDELVHILPIVRPEQTKRGFYDDATGDLDVDLLHRGFLRLFKLRGGVLQISAAAKNIRREDNRWKVSTPAGEFSGNIIVNAAGAWGDLVAGLAGVAPIGLQPKRRSIGVIPVEGHENFMSWPMMVDCAESWYAKPQSGKLIVSSADETPVEPHDAFADDEAIARGIDRMMQATTLEVNRLDHSWGGLRTFSPDRTVVAGYEPTVKDFFWLVGQGGAGIQTSPALSCLAASLALRQEVEDFAKPLLPEILPDRYRR